MNARTVALLLAALGMLLFAGIPATVVHAAPTPTLTIVSPTNNAVVGNGTPVAVVFVTSNFNLTDPGTAGPGPTSNVGHVEVYVDGTLWELTSDPTVVLPLASGTHTIRLRLVADNGTGLNPEVAASVSVTTSRGPVGGAPGIRITFPRPGAFRGPDTAVSFDLTNFALVPPGGPARVPNEGHIEVLLDGVLYEELTVYAPAHFSDLPDGDHTATLRLVDNARNPLTPDVSDSLAFHVAATAILDIAPELAVANLVLAAAVVVVLFYPIRRRER